MSENSRDLLAKQCRILFLMVTSESQLKGKVEVAYDSGRKNVDADLAC